MSKATKRASYKAGVEYIALNDEPTFMETDLVLGLPTVQMLSELFGKPAEDVARDVIRFRSMEEAKEV